MDASPPKIYKRRDIFCLGVSIIAAAGVLIGVIVLIVTRSKGTYINDTASLISSSALDLVTEQPSTEPSSLRRTQLPSSQPSWIPSGLPSFLPSSQPSGFPNSLPRNNPSESPSVSPTYMPSTHPSDVPSIQHSLVLSATPSATPTSQPALEHKPSNFTQSNATQSYIFSASSDSLLESPTRSPTLPTPKPSCFSFSIYDSIDRDIATIKNNIIDDVIRSHFLGGIVRLAAHDFMDYDRNDSNRMGSDGCIDEFHDANSGLETIWCDDCELTIIYEDKYSHISRADFWIASAQAVVRQTSIGNALDLKDTFLWGRKDTDSCPGSAERLPTPSGCRSIEQVFLTRMGLDWKDAVALMGAHTLGRGNKSFSGHHGMWVATDDAAQVFDKTYYDELYRHAWRPRNMGLSTQDWTHGDANHESTKMMLNTDICLVFDIDQNFPCCSKTNLFSSSGSNQCNNKQLSKMQCTRYSEKDTRIAATNAVQEYLGGESPNSNNEPFYNAFTDAWKKSTTNGWNDLLPLSETC